MHEGAGGLDRRTLIKAVGAAGALVSVPAAAANEVSGRKRRHAIVGTGHRARVYQDAIWGPHKDRNDLVAICDTNPGRLAFTARRAAPAKAAAPKVYLADAFDRMIVEQRPDTIIVTTPDSLHDDYIVRALDAGCDVITEKPMTTTADKAQRILDAVKRNGRHVRVAFNYRYTPPRTQVKELLMQGEIGDVLSVDFNWLLDTTHGADYFRRWHSRKEISGGLMVHKATHHFDLVNWWLSALPVTVLASGKREFYTPQMARRLGLDSYHERCRTCPEKAECSFFLDIRADAGLKALYADNEHYDGYYRDRCVWRPDITIEDTMNVVVGYDTGATLSYSLNACNAWEGYHIAFNGTKGRLEHSIVERTYVAGGDMVQGGSDSDRVKIRLYPLRGPARDVAPRTGTGGHGGGDDIMMADLFGPPTADGAGRVADERSGCYSILIGAAANRCFETGQPVAIAQMVRGLGRPDLPPMPTREQPVPMPPRAKRV
jgi:predicted dehydrogenase